MLQQTISDHTSSVSGIAWSCGASSTSTPIMVTAGAKQQLKVWSIDYTFGVESPPLSTAATAAATAANGCDGIVRVRHLDSFPFTTNVTTGTSSSDKKDDKKAKAAMDVDQRFICVVRENTVYTGPTIHKRTADKNPF